VCTVCIEGQLAIYENCFSLNIDIINRDALISIFIAADTASNTRANIRLFVAYIRTLGIIPIL
jgi:hypothetical protein